MPCPLPWTRVDGYRVHDVPDGDDRPMQRAGGDVVCEDCGDTYYKHPHASRPVDWENRPFLHVLCNGDLVKL